jgi:MFS family permease
MASTTGGEEGGAGLPRAVWVLSWVSFFADVSSEMVYPLLPLFLVGVLGASKTVLGVVEGSAVLVVAAMAAAAGFRSDRARRRVPWIRWGYGLPVAGKAVIAAAPAWPVVLGGRLLDRVGKGLRGAPRDALLSDAVPADRRGRAFGLHRAFDTAGALAGVVLSAFLLWRFTGTPRGESGGAAAAPESAYRLVFAVGAALGLASLALTFAVREAEPAPDASVPPPAEGAAAREPLPRSYWSVLVLFVLFALANSSDTFLLLRIADLGWSPWAVVLAYALFNVTYAALSYPAGAVSDRLGRLAVVGAGWAAYVGVYAGFALLPASAAWGVWPLMALYGAYMALTDGVGKALVADHAPRGRRGAAMGLFHATTGLAGLCASLVAGALWDRVGAPAALGVGAAFAAVALATLPFAARRSAP